VTGTSPWGPPPAWRSLEREEVESLAAIYADVDAALAPIASACRVCGQCCQFTPGGIVLFATALELAYLVGEGGGAGLCVGGQEFAADLHGHATAQRDHATLTQKADAAWTCPWQEGSQCTARDRRMLGCRTYFCDAAARAAGEAVYAAHFGRLRQAAAAGRLGWYGPARVCLASWAATVR
jgi:hypothetical protein